MSFLRTSGLGEFIDAAMMLGNRFSYSIIKRQVVDPCGTSRRVRTTPTDDMPRAEFVSLIREALGDERWSSVRKSHRLRAAAMTACSLVIGVSVFVVAARMHAMSVLVFLLSAISAITMICLDPGMTQADATRLKLAWLSLGRCPGCGYRIDVKQIQRCPECGATWHSDDTRT